MPGNLREAQEMENDPFDAPTSGKKMLFSNNKSPQTSVENMSLSPQSEALDSSPESRASNGNVTNAGGEDNQSLSISTGVP